MITFCLQRSFRRLQRLTAAVCLVVLGPMGYAQIHLKITAGPQIVESFKQWTAATPWDKIDNYNSSNANRPTLDLLLQLQALKAGGLAFDFEIVPAPHYERAKLEVINGAADLTAETIWDDDIAENAATLFKSDVIIPNGAFEKGIYGLPSNAKLLAVTSLEELRRFVGVTVATWKYDLKTLEAMELAGVESGAKGENVFLMIEKGRADFTLGEFSSAADLGVKNAGVTLVPVPNCKVAIAGSRSWIVSKKSPHAAVLVEALQKGVAVMRAEGRLERALKESGFFNPKVVTWKRLF